VQCLTISTNQIKLVDSDEKGKGVDTYGNPKREIWGYFITRPGGLVECPPDGKKSFLSLLQDESISND
jgi:hypothetical protein